MTAEEGHAVALLDEQHGIDTALSALHRIRAAALFVTHIGGTFNAAECAALCAQAIAALDPPRLRLVQPFHHDQESL